MNTKKTIKITNNELFAMASILTTIKSDNFKFNKIIIKNAGILGSELKHIRKAIEGMSEEAIQAIGLEDVEIEILMVPEELVPEKLNLEQTGVVMLMLVDEDEDVVEDVEDIEVKEV